MNVPFWKKGLCFSCTQCSACCRFDPGFVFLSENDLENLQKWGILDRNSFIDKYCRWVSKGDGYLYLSLKEKSNYDCILWDGGCTAYQYRPIQCSSYPFWNSLLKDEDCWNANAQDCPGINKGELHSAEEIQEILEKRGKESYIRIKE